MAGRRPQRWINSSRRGSHQGRRRRDRTFPRELDPRRDDLPSTVRLVHDNGLASLAPLSTGRSHLRAEGWEIPRRRRGIRSLPFDQELLQGRNGTEDHSSSSSISHQTTLPNSHLYLPSHLLPHRNGRLHLPPPPLPFHPRSLRIRIACFRDQR